jgi:tyrosine-protein phosphatase YwqE
MFSRLFNRNRPEKERYDDVPVPENANWGFLGADMHSHFIPGIDDGAKTPEDSLFLLRSMEEIGYRTIVTTPHVMIDYYPNTTETILAGLETLQLIVKNNNLNLTVRAAAEYYIDDYFVDLIEKSPLLPIVNNEVLVEFSMLYEPPMLINTLFRLQSLGYKPIIAHPERYVFFHNDFDRYRDLKDRGCLLQLNMLSLTGYYGRNVMKAAEDMMSRYMYDYCGSDMHHDKHTQGLRNMLKTRIYNSITGYPFLNSKLCF